MPWSTPLRLSDYFSNPMGQRYRRPPAGSGVYAVSCHSWTGREPKPEALVLYVGQSAYLRYRIGQFVGDALGFTGDDRRYAGSYFHIGGHRVWYHCETHRLPIQSLFIAWHPDCCCLDCAEGGLIDLLNPPCNAAARGCAQHSQRLALQVALG